MEFATSGQDWIRITAYEAVKLVRVRVFVENRCPKPRHLTKLSIKTGISKATLQKLSANWDCDDTTRQIVDGKVVQWG